MREFLRKGSEVAVQKTGHECLDHRQTNDRAAVGRVVRQLAIERLADRLHLLSTANDDHAAAGRRESAVDPIEQPSFEALLESQNSPTDGGLVDAERLGRRHHGLMLGEDQDVA
jgi:hypothetical protein